MLKVDFYESGQGETILIEFPDGGYGLVDAHPSKSKARPKIEDLVAGRNLHFLCLTHPHADHGLDLHKALSAAGSVRRYWHTVGDVPALLYAVSQHEVYPNRFSELFAQQIRLPWLEYLIDLYDEVGARADDDPTFVQKLNDERRSDEIAGVKVHFLGPLESAQNRFTAAYSARMRGENRGKPNENTLSAILALEYAGHLVVLGADALAENWKVAEERCRREGLPKTILLKVPHHGGHDALGHPHEKRSYLDLCLPMRQTRTVLFGGDTKHPHRRVFDRLKTRTSLHCLANGLKPPNQGLANPLGLAIPGAHAVITAPTCNPHLGFRLLPTGQLECNAGNTCSFCTCN